MSPILKNVNIPFEAIGEHMQNFVEQNKLSKKHRRGLIGSMFSMHQNVANNTPYKHVQN